MRVLPRPAHTIATQRFRRLYYIGAALLLVITVGALAIPTLVRIRSELSMKTDQLSTAVIAQKEAYLEAVVVEKIGDIERIHGRLRALDPPLSTAAFDSQFRAEVRSMVHDTVLPDDGYVWINEILDFAGGDGYAIRFVHPNLVGTEGQALSTSQTDVVGNLPYLEELDGVREFGQIHFDYYFRKNNSDAISHKLSFAKLYEPYNWVVATGVYLDDVDVLIAAETDRMVATTNRTVWGIILAVVAGSSLLLGVTVVFETRIRALIDGYMDRQRHTNEELIDEKAKLEEVNRQKDRLFSIIAHDLSSPMATLRIISDYLSSTVDDSGETPLSIDELSCELDSSVESIRALLDDLLMWARTQAGDSSLVLESVTAASQVSSVVDACMPVASVKGVALSSRVVPGLMVTADPHMLRTILRNLVTNAVKFTRAGGSVSIEASGTDGSVQFLVRDTGRGMDEAAISRLFSIEHARSTRGTEDERGTGLGLIVCKEFVDMHGGTISVRSTPGAGSVFTVTVPPASPAATAESVPAMER